MKAIVALLLISPIFLWGGEKEELVTNFLVTDSENQEMYLIENVSFESASFMVDKMSVVWGKNFSFFPSFRFSNLEEELVVSVETESGVEERLFQNSISFPIEEEIWVVEKGKRISPESNFYAVNGFETFSWDYLRELMPW